MTEQNNIIIDYLSYLRDVSRKIVSRNGFERALLEKSRKNPTLTLQVRSLKKTITKFDGTEFEHFKGIAFHLDKNQDKRLFCGFGLICGNKNDRTFAAPILFVECNLEDNKSDGLKIEIDMETLSLNYDLLSSITRYYRIAEDEEYNVSFEKETEFVQNIEREIKQSNKPEVLLEVFASEVFLKMQKTLEEFSEIPISKNEYSFPFQNELYKKRNLKDQEEREKSIFEGPLMYVESTHFFTSQIPDQLSTYEALNQLTEEARQSEFKNPILEKLLRNALVGERVKMEHEDDDNIRTLIDYLPISLSEKQKTAIYRAWTSDISYVQGPPGTGKSHTISAIVLSAVHLGRKVLVISQKPPALKVVKDKLEPYLNGLQKTIYFDKDVKKLIREHIKSLLEYAYDKYRLQDKINLHRKEHEGIVDELNKTLKQLQHKRIILKQNLEKEKSFRGGNTKFQQSLMHFKGKFHEIKPEYQFARIKNIEAYEKTIKTLEKIQSLKNKTLTADLYKNKFINHFKAKFNPATDFIADEYLCNYSLDLICLNNDYTGIQAIYGSSVPQDSKLLRTDIQKHENDIAELQKRLVKVKSDLNCLELLRKTEYVNELEKFHKMLYNVKATLILNKMKEIDFKKIIDLMPYWAAEIRHLGQIFPMKPDMFDLIVVDEASQVNLAEVIPAFYRGAKICIVGDHKQLSLESIGLSFSLSNKFDTLIWTKHLTQHHNISYDNGKKRNLTVTTASILDFIRSPENTVNLRDIMLDEHFRSEPALAKFTNDMFYDGQLKVMTETPDRISLSCFKVIKVNGKRNENKAIPEEAERIVQIIKDLTKSVDLPAHIKPPITIGVISMIRNQCNLISELLEEKVRSNIYDEIMIGTPEEFQGHERDVIIFSLCLDSSCARGTGFHQNQNRFNVATSRARKFTIIVYSEIPDTHSMTHKYFRHFGFEPNIVPVSEKEFKPNYDPITWKFDPAKYESDFERIVYSYIKEYIEKKKQLVPIEVFNQVVSCGQKRLDFVLYNPKNKKFIAIEVDGNSHFIDDGKTVSYSDEHLEREAILRRAGWQIINTPYYCWWKDGWLCDKNDKKFVTEINRIYGELDKYLYTTP